MLIDFFKEVMYYTIIASKKQKSNIKKQIGACMGDIKPSYMLSPTSDKRLLEIDSLLS